jgi:uncharacterized protein (DUF111 family)
VRLLGDAPIYSGTVQKELVTPTGALIATSYASSYGPIPAMSVECVGYGAGERDNSDTPNVLRILIGRAADHMDAEACRRHQLRINDMSPQLSAAMGRLYAGGAGGVYPCADGKTRRARCSRLSRRREARRALGNHFPRDDAAASVTANRARMSGREIIRSRHRSATCGSSGPA